MKHFQLLITTILLVFTLSVNASDSAPVSSVDHEKCGLSDTGVIDPWDMSICKDDFVFNIFYENFSSIFQSYVFPVYDFKYLNSIEDIDYSNLTETEINEALSEKYKKVKITNIFETIFKKVSELSLIFISIFITYQAILGVLRTQEDGSFFGEDYDVKKNIKYYLLAAFLIIPVGNVLIVHIIVLFIILIAIIPANFIYGFFLYNIMIGLNPSDLNRIDVRDIKKSDHNYFYANQYFETIVNAHLCQIRTTNFLMSANLENNLTNRSEREAYLSCQLPENEMSYESFSSNPESDLYNNPKGFYGYQATKINKKYNVFSKLSFSHQTKACDIDRFANSMRPFKCAQIQLPDFYNNNNILIKYFVNKDINPESNSSTDYFLESIKDTVGLFDNNVPTSYEIIAKWNLLLSKVKENAIALEEEFQNNQYEYTEEEVKKILEIAKKINNNSADEELSEISYHFHQGLLNNIMIGTVIFSLNEEDLYSKQITYKNTNVVDRNLLKSLAVANLIMETECLIETDSIITTRNFVDNARGDKKTTNCYNPFNDKIYSNISGLKDITPEQMKNILLEKYEEIGILKKEIVEEVYNYRKEIDNSLHKSIVRIGADKQLNGTAITLQDARQKGFMSFPKVLLNIENYHNNSDKYRVLLANAMFNTLSINDNNKISDYSILEYISSPFSSDVFNLSDQTKTILSDYKSRFIGSKFIKPINITVMNSDGVINEAVESDITGSAFVYNPFTPIKEAIGLTDNSLLFDLNNDFSFNCAENIDNCPLPQNNPLVSLNKAGQDYITSGLSFVAGATSVMIAKATINTYLNSASRINRKIEKANEITISTGEVKTKRTVKSKLYDTLSSFIDDILLLVVYYGLILIFLGILLAFGIPLLAFIYMLINFISWFILCLNVWIISPVFAGYLVSVNDNQREINSFFQNYILNILLKPVLIIIGMIFLWSFYYVTIFLLNLTVFHYFETLISMPKTFGVLSSAMVNQLIVSILLIYIIYQLTKNVFNLITNIYEKVFEKINVRESQDSPSGLLDDFLGYMAINQLKDYSTQPFKLLTNKNKKNRLSNLEKRNILEKVSNNELVRTYEGIYNPEDLTFKGRNEVGQEVNKKFRSKEEMLRTIYANSEIANFNSESYLKEKFKNNVTIELPSGVYDPETLTCKVSDNENIKFKTREEMFDHILKNGYKNG